MTDASNRARRNRQRGIDAERRAIKDLERVGYEVIRAAGSHGTFDLVAYGPLGCRFVQIKTDTVNSRVALAREAVAEADLPPHSTGELWRWQAEKRGGTWQIEIVRKPK